MGRFSDMGHKVRGKFRRNKSSPDTAEQAMPAQGPGLFSNFDQKVRDTLNKDYTTEHKVLLSSATANGVTLGSSVGAKNGIAGGDLAVGYTYKKATVEARTDMDLNMGVKVVLTDIVPSARAIVTLKYPNHESGKVEAQYLHKHAALTASVDTNKTPNVNVSATMGTPNIAFGTEASYKVDSGEFTKYNAGVSLTQPNYGASVFLADKGDTVRASCYYHPDQLKSGVVVGEFARKLSTNENTLTMGSSYSVNSHTTFKAKLNNHGHLGTLVQHEMSPQSFLTLSGSFDSLDMEKKPRIGLTLSLKP